MLKAPTPKQHALEMVTLEELVPHDHLLRTIERYIDFEFIREATVHLYCDNNGRPAIDPVLLFKMLFIGYLFGIRSQCAFSKIKKATCCRVWVNRDFWLLTLALIYLVFSQR